MENYIVVSLTYFKDRSSRLESHIEALLLGTKFLYKFLTLSSH